MKRETVPNYLNGVPELLILRLLKDHEMYGYELVQAIRTASSEAIILGEGVVYPLLHTLEREGALQSRRQTVAGRNRIYYTLTPAGDKRLTQTATAWTRITQAVSGVLGMPARA